MQLLSFHIREIGVDGLSKVSIPTDQRARILEEIRTACRADEIFYLGTCNRVEFLFLGEDVDINRYPWQERPLSQFGLTDVLNHLFSIVLATDSIVVGESQIMGQFKHAYDYALEHGLIGSKLSPVLNSIICESKSIRCKTKYSHHHTSVSTIAAQSLLKKISSPRVLFVGAGETNHLFARYIKKRFDSEVYWTTRSKERLGKTVDLLGGQPISWKDYNALKLPKVDAIVLATHAPGTILNRDVLKITKPKYVYDLSIPPNASASDCFEEGVEYIGLDSLTIAMDAHKSEFNDFIECVDEHKRKSVRTIIDDIEIRKHSGLFSKFSENTESEFERVLVEAFGDELLHLDEETKKLFEKRVRKLLKKINHNHIDHVKSHILSNKNVG